MLKRITKIKNIGKFYDWSLPGLEFKDKTVIVKTVDMGYKEIEKSLPVTVTGN